MIQKLCMPALIYLIYMVIHITIDLYYGLFNMAIIKIGIGTIITLLLNILCENNMSVISWLVISIPFVMMTIIAVFILVGLGLNPATGKSNTNDTTDTTTTSNTTATSVSTTTAPPNSPPSIYAYPVAVNTPYYGALANSIRAIQSNQS
jgi:hypothetical protein